MTVSCRKLKCGKSDGFSIIEAILAASLFLLVASAFAGALIYGQQSLFSAGSRSRAVFLAEEGLEAVPTLRDADFSNLDDGTKGLTIEDGTWKLTDQPQSIDIFTRWIEISTIDEKTKEIRSTVSCQWNFSKAKHCA